jgi:hypothetical protein
MPANATSVPATLTPGGGRHNGHLRQPATGRPAAGTGLARRQPSSNDSGPLRFRRAARGWLSSNANSRGRYCRVINGMTIRGTVARGLLVLPGGIRLLGGARTLFRGLRNAAGFAKHPVASWRRKRDHTGWAWVEIDWVALGTRVEEDRPILSSNRLAGRCRYVYRQGGHVIVHDDVENNWYFCKTSDAREFFATAAPADEFVLFTGHTDLPIDHTHRRYLRRRELKAWFAANAMLKHPKLRARPFGIGALAQPKDTATIRAVQEKHLPKTQLFHNQFRVEHNPFERAYCLAQTGLPLGPLRPFLEYLEELASSYFCISPNGIGVDCARTWEALLVGTIPVVHRSLVTDHHPDFPIVALQDWAQFRSIDFSPELYKRVWNGWDPDELLLERYLQRIERILRSLDKS